MIGAGLSTRPHDYTVVSARDGWNVTGYQSVFCPLCTSNKKLVVGGVFVVEIGYFVRVCYNLQSDQFLPLTFLVPLLPASLSSQKTILSLLGYRLPAVC